MSTSANVTDLEIESINEENEAILADLARETTTFLTLLAATRDRNAAVEAQLEETKNALLEVQRPLKEEHDDILSRLVTNTKDRLYADDTLSARFREVCESLKKNREQVEVSLTYANSEESFSTRSTRDFLRS